jgi:hypothetical protein
MSFTGRNVESSVCRHGMTTILSRSTRHKGGQKSFSPKARALQRIVAMFFNGIDH